MKIIHLTDTHLVSPGQELYGLLPDKRLRAAIQSINALHADADLVVITGDLTHWGEREAYLNLRACLADLVPPVMPILGNHDDRIRFREIFPSAATDEHGFVQSLVEGEDEDLLFLDTNQPGTHMGWYCDQRLAWLQAMLDNSSDRPILLFMHHPPFDVELPTMDQIGLHQKQAFEAVMRPHRSRIRHLFFGHVHRPISGSWMGIPFSTLRATSHQVWLDFEARGKIPGSHEPPAYGVVLTSRQAVLVHNHDFLDDSAKFEL